MRQIFRELSKNHSKELQVTAMIVIACLALVFAAPGCSAPEQDVAVSPHNLVQVFEFEVLERRVETLEEEQRVFSILLDPEMVRSEMQTEIDNWRDKGELINSGTYADSLGYKARWLDDRGFLREQDIVDLMAISDPADKDLQEHLTRELKGER